MDQHDPNLTIVLVEQQSPLLGRQMVHDERSRGFVALRSTIDRSQWRDRAIRVYDPTPNPNQTVGNCTMCAKAMQLNSIGNRMRGRILDMKWAMDGYRIATGLDPWPGQWEPDDTGSSGLASCQTAQQVGVGGEYVWEFEGADGVVQNLMQGRTMSLGTWWYEGMFTPDSSGVIHPTGDKAGGHQYLARGYDADRDRVLIRCWWGSFRDVWISREDLDSLLRDGGDAHWQQSL